VEGAESRGAQQAAETAEREVAVHRLRSHVVPVMDMRFCIDNLDSIRSEAGDFTLRDFSVYRLQITRRLHSTSRTRSFPNRLVQGNNPQWAPFYDLGQSRRGSDGSMEADPDHSPFFRVSQELLGRMLHTMKKQYVDSDKKRRPT
jgi:hypothetical protein